MTKIKQFSAHSIRHAVGASDVLVNFFAVTIFTNVFTVISTLGTIQIHNIGLFRVAIF